MSIVDIGIKHNSLIELVHYIGLTDLTDKLQEIQVTAENNENYKEFIGWYNKLRDLLIASNIDVETISYDDVNKLYNAADTIQNITSDDTFQNIINSADSKVNAQVQNLVIELSNVYDTVYPIMARSQFVKLSQGFSNHANKTVNELVRFTEETEAKIQDKLAEADHILQKARVLVGAKVVSEHAAFFKTQSDRHFRSAMGWLGVSLLLFLVGVAMSVYLLYYYKYPDNPSTPTVVSISVSKLMLFTLFFFALSFSTKAARAHQHNTVVYKHRALSLQTFESFSDVASDPDLKKQILITTTHAIFANSPSGFLVNDKDKVEAPLIGQLQNILGDNTKSGS